jgi:putative endonuclease
MKQPCVYIVASKRHGTLYTGVTANLPRRAFEHREGLVKGFSAKYGCKILVWYELHDTMINAITREKQIKAGSRARKLALIETLNPEWNDLYESLRSLRVFDMSSLSHPSLRAQRSNPWPPRKERMDCFVATLLAMTAGGGAVGKGPLSLHPTQNRHFARRPFRRE